MTTMPPPVPHALADAVRDELVAAGLPVLPSEPGDSTPSGGVSIVGNDPNSGVWVGWEAGDALRNASQDALCAGAYRRDGSEVHSAIRHSGIVIFAMAEAIQAILESAGFHVDKDADDMQPGMLLVRARRPGPTWRDPVVPPLAGSGGYLPGVRVRLVGGEYAGCVTTVISAWWRCWPVEGPPDTYRVAHPQGAGELDVPATAVELAGANS